MLFGIGCDTPHTEVVIDNNYPATTTDKLFVYHAFWQAVAFTTPIAPGSSSDPQDTVPATSNTAYVLLAPGWDPAPEGEDPSPPSTFIVLQSRSGFAVRLNDTLHIPVNDEAFSGNCRAESFLSQDEADFITQRVFGNDFAGLSYDAATCTTSEDP